MTRGSFLGAALLGCVAAAAAALAAVSPPVPLERRAAADPDSMRFAPIGDVVEWLALDWQAIDRERIGEIYLHLLRQPQDPLGMYLEAVTYRAEPESLGLGAFAALAAGERAERQRLAASELAKARRFLLLVKRLQQVLVDSYSSPGFDMPNGPTGGGDGLAHALRHLVLACGLDPSNAIAWYDQAALSGIAGDWERQGRCLETALGLLAGKTDGAATTAKSRLWLDRAWLCRDLGRWDEGLAAAESALALEPETHEGGLLRGLMLAEMGRHQEAGYLASLLQRADTYEFTWGWYGHDFGSGWIRGLSYANAGQSGMALHALGRVDPKRKFPYAFRYWNDMGRMHEMLGERQAALDCWSLAGLWHPFLVFLPFGGYQAVGDCHGRPGADFYYYQAFGHFYAGGSLYAYAADKLREFETATEPRRRELLALQANGALGACIRRGIRTADAQVLRGWLASQLGDHDAARADLMAGCAALEPVTRADGASFRLAGTLALEAGQAMAACPFLERAVGLDPGNAPAWRALGVAQVMAGRGEQGRRALDAAIARDDSSADAWYNRGLLNFNEDRMEEAMADLERAAALRPGDPSIEQLLRRARLAWESR